METRTGKCGCKKHEVKVGEEALLIWRGEYWRQDCALRHAMTDADFKTNQLEKLRLVVGQLTSDRNKLNRLIDRITRLPCSACNEPVGKCFDFQGDAVICHYCLNLTMEIGGEG